MEGAAAAEAEGCTDGGVTSKIKRNTDIADMSSKVARSIRRGLAQAVAYAKQAARTADNRVHIPADTDVKVIPP